MDRLTPESAELVYDGDYVAVAVERWDGRDREIVERPDVAAVVAVDRDGYVTLVRQHRPAAKRALVEIPAGRLEPGEEPLASARRELEEETGLRGGSWTAVKTFWTTPGFCRERVHLFFADGLERGEPSPDEGEEVEVVRIPVAELAGHLPELEDGKTLIGVLLFLGRDRVGSRGSGSGR